MGKVKAIAINELANPCTGDEPLDVPCCKDVSEELRVEEITQVSFDFDSQPDLFIVAIITWALTDDFCLEVNETPKNQFYIPPLPELDVQSDYQVFTI